MVFLLHTISRLGKFDIAVAADLRIDRFGIIVAHDISWIGRFDIAVAPPDW